ncbi:hypothetical protein BgiBS90_003119 [Biomphalaria glabrata]|nr:hypothetical protein BgiBS90_003119 [Biomphalaria glabrata]
MLSMSRQCEECCLCQDSVRNVVYVVCVIFVRTRVTDVVVTDVVVTDVVVTGVVVTDVVVTDVVVTGVVVTDVVVTDVVVTAGRVRVVCSQRVTIQWPSGHLLMLFY